MKSNAVEYELRPAVTPGEIEAACELMEEYAANLGFPLDFQGFAAELDGLPGDYAPPGGCLIVAWREGTAAGCVALHRWADGVCEMKRLYVRPSHRGGGLGRWLAEAVVSEARRLGYARMVLDSVRSLAGANALYRAMGFQECEAYRPNPRPDAVYLECKL